MPEKQLILFAWPNSCIFMEILSLESIIQHSINNVVKMLSTFMKITRVNKLKNKITNYSPLFKCFKLLYELKYPSNSFVFVEMTPFGAV